jgi:hypothetical protein
LSLFWWVFAALDHTLLHAPPRITQSYLVSPQKIQPALPCPNAFDAFWDSKLQDLAAVAMNPKLEPGESSKPNVDYFKITMDNNIRG